MGKILVAGLGGFVGSAARFWIATETYRILGQDFPYGTLVVNVIGCFLIGFLMMFFEERFVVNPDLRIFLIVGILGGFTTFSSFSYETLSLIREGSYAAGTTNILCSLLSCLGATWLGGLTGKLL